MPAEAVARRTILLFFGIGLTVWEIVVRHAAEPVVFIVLAAWLGFKPAIKMDALLRQPEPQDTIKEPVQDSVKEAVKP